MRDPGDRLRTVWLCNHYAQEPTAPGGTRHYWLSHCLAPLGWRAPILAASVELNTGRQRLPKGVSHRLDEIAGVQFLWVRTPRYEGSGLGRLRNMASYAWQVQRPAVGRALPRPDVIVGSSVHPLAAWAGLRLARRHRVPFVFEVRDLWPETLIQFGMLRRDGIPARLLRRLEGHLYRNAARIITLLPEAWQYIARSNIPRERIVWIPNGVSVDSFPENSPRPSHDHFDLLYFGAHGQANDLATMLRAMAVVQSAGAGRQVRLRLIGDGPLKHQLRELAGELGLTNTIFEDPVPYSEIPRLASEADAFIITVLNRPELYRYGVSMNKLFDYLAAARPILLAMSAANNPVDEAEAGISVPPENPQALGQAILRLAAMPDGERRRLGANGRRYLAERHDYPVLAQRLAATLDAVINEAPVPRRNTER